jgi:site-specific recombinase XerD
MRAQSTTPPASPPAQAPTGDLDVLVRSWRRQLVAQNKSPRTILAYMGAMRDFRAALAEHGMPLNVAAITREHIETCLTARLATQKASTVHLTARVIKLFFAWLVDEGELPRSPAERVKPPVVPEEHVAVLSADAPCADALRALFRACEGKDFDARRDMALFRLMADSGLRLNEAAALRVEDVDLDQRTVYIGQGKGRRPRLAALGAKTVAALDKYLRVRARRGDAGRDALFLGQRGLMTDSGIARRLDDRAQQAGLGHVHPHQLRHTAAHRWLSAGGAESDLMRLMGWRSRSMLERYGSVAATERAIAAHHRLSLNDDL